MSEQGSNLVYLDNAATSFPKPPEVVDAVVKALTLTANPGRSGHRLSLNAARLIYEARVLAAQSLGVEDARRVVFTKSCTESINVVVRGLLKSGDHVITTSMEHNAVSRTLRHLEHSGMIDLTIVEADEEGHVDVAALVQVRRSTTALVVMVHGSNVTGAVNDIKQAAASLAPTPLLIDAAQTAGHLPIEVDAWGLSYVAFSGHKGFLGPAGVGGLCLGKNAKEPSPLIRGGTGSSSEHDIQPTILPDSYEAGTPNVAGIAGLAAGINALNVKGVQAIAEADRATADIFINGLATLPGIRLIGPLGSEPRLPTFSIIFEDRDPGVAALELERKFGILVRAGLHCAPWAHRTVRTFPKGSVRISFGPTTPPNACVDVLTALTELTAGA